MRTTINLILILCFFFSTSCSTDLSKEIVGEWKVSDVKVNTENIPQQLIKNAKILSLATKYEFKTDGMYCMTVSKNTLERGRKHKGQIIINSENKQITLKTDTLLFEKNGNWKLFEKNDFNKPMFNSMKMKVEKTSSNQLILSGKGKSYKIFYTLDRIEK